MPDALGAVIGIVFGIGPVVLLCVLVARNVTVRELTPGQIPPEPQQSGNGDKRQD